MSAQPDSLKVAIDISAIPFGRGVSRYTSDLVTALAALPEVHMTLLGAVGKQWSELSTWSQELRGRPTFRALPVPSTWLGKLWESTGLPKWSWLAPQSQLLHAWEWQQPVFKGQPWVVTIHDLAHLLFPETAHPQVVQQFERLLRRLETDPLAKIIAVSESTKRDIIRLTTITPDRITVIPEALPTAAKYAPSEREVKSTLANLKLAKPYFLFVGTTEPRKNLLRVIEAWQQSAAKNYDLVLAGAPGWEKLPDHPGLIKLGYVQSGQLSSLYCGATALLFPSLYEGFGLPVLEAFFHRCPVITSRVSSLPEVAGEAAILVDPYDSREIAAGIKTLLEMTPAQLQKLHTKMQAQWQKFSWDKTAQETVAVYRKAINAATK